MSDRSSFVGRRSELADLHRRFDGGARLVTISGPGGAGKTRLARRFLRDFAEQHRKRTAVFVDATATRELADLLDVVGQALEIELAGSGLVQRLGRALARRSEGLVVVDNVEQVSKAAAEVLDVWLSSAPRLSWLVTSRVPLGIDGEERFVLPPLSVPSPNADVATILESESVSLFLDRARSAGLTIGEDEASLGAVAQTVRRLDGLPLPIELVAARAPLVGVQALPQLLDDRLNEVRRRSQKREHRHDSMQATFDWSWELLTEWERDALAQSSVFRGGFDANALGEVIDLSAHQGSPQPGSPHADGLSILESLRDAGFLLAIDDRGGAARFRLYEPIRMLAASRLEAQQTTLTHRRHATHYLQRLENHPRRYRYRADQVALREMTRDRENVQAILERALDGELPADAGVKALDILFTVHRRSSPVDIPVDRLAQLKERLGAADHRQVGRLALVRGYVALDRAEREAATVLLSQAEEAAVEDSDWQTAIEATTALARVVAQQGDIEGCESVFQRAEGYNRVFDEPILEAQLLRYRAAVAFVRDDVVSAKTYLSTAVDLAEKQGAKDLIGDYTIPLITAVTETEGWPAAEALVDRTLQQVTFRGWPEVLAMGIAAEVYAAVGRLADAREAVDRGLTLTGELGLVDRESWTRLCSTNVYLAAGDVENACSEAKRALVGIGPVNRLLVVWRLALAQALAGRRSDLSSLLADIDLEKAREADRRAMTVVSEVVKAFDSGPAERQATTRALREQLGEHRRWMEAHTGTKVELWWALRFAEHALDEALVVHIVVASTGQWFRCGEAEPVSLARRKKLAAILATLAANRDRRLSTAAIFEACWPGERADPKSSKHRVQVAVSQLRSLGLGEALSHEDEGYALVADVEVSDV